MIERLLERLPLGQADIFAIDSNPSHRPVAEARLRAWAAGHGAAWTSDGEARWRVESAQSIVDITWVTASLFDAVLPGDSFDAVLAHAFLDLVDLDRALPRLVGPLRAGGLLYLSLNFDGLTAFLPETEAALDRAIVDAYHATMDARTSEGRPSGDSRTGRRLLSELSRHDAEVLDAGSSDWIVFSRDGRYANDEEVVLLQILDMVGQALGGDAALADDLPGWIARRRSQVDRGELVFIAHQLDVLGRKRRR